ncbi:MAG: hypothetical protein ACYCST_12850 [Acidimicrobiales bacterium]
MTFASGYQVVYQALVVLMAGLVIYAFLNARRERLGEAATPTDNPVLASTDGLGPLGESDQVAEVLVTAAAVSPHL